MIKLSMKHVNAICHAEFLVNGMMYNAPIPMMRSQLEDDLLRLAELKMYIIKQSTETKDLFKQDPENNGDTDRS